MSGYSNEWTKGSLHWKRPCLSLEDGEKIVKEHGKIITLATNHQEEDKDHCLRMMYTQIHISITHLHEQQKDIVKQKGTWKN